MNSHDARNVKASSAMTTRVHGGEKGGIERQHALRRFFVPSIAERKQARRERRLDRPPRGRRRTARRRGNARRAMERRAAGCGSPAPIHRADAQRPLRRSRATRPHRTHRRPTWPPAIGRSQSAATATTKRKPTQPRSKVSVKARASSAARRARPLELAALSEISSIPAVSRAATSFISKSTLPRITPSLASMR